MTAVHRIPPWVASSGLVILVIGTFLPWFRSGTVQRHSYQAVGLADRLALFHNAFLSAALHVWIAVPVLSAVSIGLFTLGFARTGATFTAVLAISVGTIALLIAVHTGGPDDLVGLTPAGPVTTLAGAGIALAGALGTFVVGTGRSQQPTTARTGGTP
jgi:hypothetical protein